ncbi:hypothetical protein GCM10010435_14540 [Winogradskya consettensis]|uniref:Uncharacterized protein n=1 Tax=Winogradskya consettensis TaxID=113560 RepID=A0A919SAT0_9ACTN|nr:hypothetical protein [Actinoplanes consettensis]GIM69120.1 hypothetical protein Aco04nite_13810 [Actinoplanes consettensis]
MQDVQPLESVGGLRFGMSRADTRRVMGEQRETFRRAPHSLTALDYYAEAGLFLTFGTDDRLRSVEATRWADPVLRGVRLLGRPAQEVLAELQAGGVVATQQDGDWTLAELGVTLGEVKEETFHSLLVSAGSAGPSAVDFFPADDPDTDPEGEFPVEAGRGFDGGPELGAGREQVRALLGPGFASTAEMGGASQDKFLEVRMVVLYDSADTVVRVTATDPTVPLIEGMAVLGRSWSEVRQDAEARGIAVVEGDAELLFPDAGCQAWPLVAGPDSALVAVSVFR